MTAPNSIRAGRAFVELFTDDSKLVRGLHSAEKKLKAAGTATGAGALIAFGDHQIDLCGLLAAVWAAAQTCFIGAGVANEGQKAQQ